MNKELKEGVELYLKGIGEAIANTQKLTYTQHYVDSTMRMKEVENLHNKAIEIIKLMKK